MGSPVFLPFATACTAATTTTAATTATTTTAPFLGALLSTFVLFHARVNYLHLGFPPCRGSLLGGAKRLVLLSHDVNRRCLSISGLAQRIFLGVVTREVSIGRRNAHDEKEG